MTTTTMAQILFAGLIGFSSVSFGDAKKCAGGGRNSELKKLMDVVDDMSKPIPYIPNDPRRPIDRKAKPEYNPIGTLKTKAGRGTAWLGNECLVWTAKHVIGEKNIIGQKVTFSVGRSNTPGKDFENTVEGVVVASGNQDGLRDDQPSEDWALVKLKTSIGRKVGFINTAQYSVEDALTCTTLEVAGFPGEKNIKKLWYQTNCPVYTEDSGRDGFSIGCSATPGNSGGPLLCRETDGSLNAIGIVMQQSTDTKESVALNFTSEWSYAKPAFQKYMNTCN